VEVIYLDFSTAFDKVQHKRLIAELRAKGISEEISRWIEHWLSDRKQIVRVGGELLVEGEVGSRVPQGTVLRQCLFSVFIDDADDCPVRTTNIIKFTYDTKCWKVVENDGDRAGLQETLERLSEWADQWGMSLMLTNAQ
jgi:hypothetical protein